MPKQKASIKNLVNSLDRKELIEIIVELSKIDRKNEKFLRLFINGSDESNRLNTLKDAKAKLRNVFFNNHEVVREHISLKNGRDIVREYSKIFKNSPDVILELELYFVDLGVEVLNDIGDMYEAFYSSMESMLGKFCDDLFNYHVYYKNFSERLHKLIEDTESIGWGFHDFVLEEVFNLEGKLGADEENGNIKQIG